MKIWQVLPSFPSIHQIKDDEGSGRVLFFVEEHISLQGMEPKDGVVARLSTIKHMLCNIL
jgi:hypothetical protein